MGERGWAKAHPCFVWGVMELLLRSQTEMLADLQALMRDNGAVRWTAAEVYGAINRALGIGRDV